MNTAPPSIRVACHVRKASLVAPVDRTLRTLERFEDEGVVEEFSVSAWPEEVLIGAGPPHGDVVAAFEEFEAWADQWNVSIRPPFVRETRHSEITGETREVLVTPVQCLAIYVNGVLAEVFPHTADPAGERVTYSVGDALALLEEGEVRGVGSGRSAETAGGEGPDGVDVSGLEGPGPGGAGLGSPGRDSAGVGVGGDPDQCPACRGQFARGQGLYACPDCEWVGVATAPGQYRSLVGRAGHHELVSGFPPGDEDSPRPGGRR